MQPTVRLNHNLLAVESEHTLHAMVELTAPEAPDHGQRGALKLAPVIDRCGSMTGDKLAVTKACAAYLVRRLAPSDELAIVTYDDAVDLVAPSRRCTPTTCSPPSPPSTRAGRPTCRGAG